MRRRERRPTGSGGLQVFELGNMYSGHNQSAEMILVVD